MNPVHQWLLERECFRLAHAAGFAQGAQNGGNGKRTIGDNPAGDFMGRFQGLISDVKTTNINTALAFKINNVVSLGIGVGVWRKVRRF